MQVEIQTILAPRVASDVPPISDHLPLPVPVHIGGDVVASSSDAAARGERLQGGQGPTALPEGSAMAAAAPQQAAAAGKAA